jgi:hypothetical protein
MPTPGEVLEYIKKHELDFNPALVNPVKNEKKYTSTKKRTLNLGVYSADMAYTSLFGMNNEALEFMKTIEGLGEQIKIETPVTESLYKLLESRYISLDSLYGAADDIFYNLVLLLRKQGRHNTLALISVGVYIECLFIAVNIVDKYEPDNLLIKELDLHRFVFQNLYKYVEMNNQNQGLNKELAYLADINSIFKQFEIKESNLVVSNNNGEISIESDYSVFIGETVFIALKEKVNKIRNEIVSD